MSDFGVQFADLEEKRIQKRIVQVYSRAQQDIYNKLSGFRSRFAVKDAAKKAEIAAETDKAAKAVLEKKYKEWLSGKVFIGKQWESKMGEVTKTIVNANAEAMNIIREGQVSVFATNANYQAYLLEKGANASFGFNLYDQKTVTKLLTKHPTLLPKWKIDEPKDYAWNYGKVQDIVTQAILQGEGIPEITKHLATDLCTTNTNRMNTFARTSITGAQNAGRIERMQEANDDGIHTKKKWVATLDSRTRDAHADLDGETAEVDEPFKNDIGEIMYPGDPNADPANVYNCRCALDYEVVGYENHGERRAYKEWDDEDGHHRESYIIEDMTYREWEKWKEGQ